MSEVKPGRLFSRRLIDHTKRARELNEDKSISGDIYFHPTEKRIVVKSIDLGMPNPLCEVNSRPGTGSKEAKKQYWEERWIEAYLINWAKRNNWRLLPAGKEYRFLCSQLKFRQDRTKGEKQGRILDLLLYDEKEERLVVLELKREANKKALATAKGELDDYISKIKDLVRIEKDAIAEAFKAPGIKPIVIKDVVGYIVWPANDKSDKELGLDESVKHGLIKYTAIREPWKRFEGEKKAGKTLQIDFEECRKPTR